MTAVSERERHAVEQMIAQLPVLASKFSALEKEIAGSSKPHAADDEVERDGKAKSAAAQLLTGTAVTW